MNDIKHWYDGAIYARISKYNEPVFAVMKSIIEKNATVLDLACGTGRFSIHIADKAKYVLGVDLSSRNISEALKQKRKSGLSNIEFFHGDAAQAAKIGKRKFDFATISFALHETQFETRLAILKQMKAVAKKIIIADYNAPQPKNMTGYFNWAVEFAAGAEHFRNFRHFHRNGGLETLLDVANMKIKKTMLDKKKVTKIVLAK